MLPLIILVILIIIIFFGFDNSVVGGYNVTKGSKVINFFNKSYKDYFYHSKFAKLESQFPNCITSKTLYQQTKPGVHKGFNVRILKKGTHIFKGFGGFMSLDKAEDYLKTGETLSWFGSKILAFSFAVNSFTSVIAYKVKKNIILLDWFDLDNIKKIMDILTQEEKERFKFYLGMISEKEFLDKYSKLYPRWDTLELYDKPIFADNTIHGCNITKKESLDPVSHVKGVYAFDIKVLPKVLQEFDFDGLIREEIQSKYETEGIFYHEEIVLRHLDKITIDRSHYLTWTNWTFKTIKPRPINLALSGRNLQYNTYNFYMNNNLPLDYVKKEGFTILSYNVCNFHNLNLDIKDDENVKSIFNLIKCLDPDIIILQESYDIYDMKGYRKISVLNGGGETTVTVYSKIAYKSKTLDLKVMRTPRGCIVLETPYGSLACVHLEIGPRNPHKHPELYRLEQLKSLVGYDMIIGDCNFTESDSEAKYLLENGYKCYSEDINTTPFNRVDLCFSKKGKFEVKTFRCNFSDHLPVLYTVKKITGKFKVLICKLINLKSFIWVNVIKCHTPIASKNKLYTFGWG